MKKLAFFSGLLGLALCGFSAPAAARDCCAYDPCEWSCCDGRFIVGADWLYWKQEQSNMDIALIENLETGVLSTSDSRFIHPKHEFNNGFRVYAGYAFPNNGWDLTVSYFNLPNHSKRRLETELATESIFFNFLQFPVSLPPNVGFSSLRTKWDSNLQNIDVDIARTITFGECFSLRPHIGCRATWMNQKYHFFADFIPDILVPVGSDVLAGRIKEKFEGVGVEGGLWAAWDFGCGFSLVGHVGGSLLYTRFHTHEHSTAFTVVPGGTDVTFFEGHNHRHFFLGTPSMDYFVGFRYASDFCDTELSAYVGWEQHVFFDVNQLALNSGNLYTQGLTLGVGVAF